MRTSTGTTVIVLLAILALAGTDNFAGGPLFTSGGTALTWPGSTGFYNVETGPFQGNANAVMVPATDAAFGMWTAVPSSALTYVNAGTLVDPGFFPPAGPPPFACPGIGLPVSVDSTNVACVVLLGVDDGQDPIIFDDDGLVSALFGIAPLAFEITEITAGTSLVKSFVVFNGPVMGPSLTFFGDIAVHEFGHFSNLDHSVTNGEVYTVGDNTGPTGGPSLGAITPGNVETMYAFAAVDVLGAATTPHADDMAWLGTMDPAPGFPGSAGTVTGTVFFPDGLTGLGGVNVIARNRAAPFVDAVSAITGAFTDGPTDGSYVLHGLTAGASYDVFIDEILAGGYATPVRSNDPFGPGAVGPIAGPFLWPEEFYNPPGTETNSDNPAATAIVVPPSPNINVITNGAATPVCGDNQVNQGNEQCDGLDDSACPGQCDPNCSCPVLDGACCTNGPGTASDCIETTQPACEGGGGLFLGPGSQCMDVVDCVPLLVTLDHVSVEETEGGNLLRWTTSIETDTVGFRVLRQTRGDRQKGLDVVSEFIPSMGHGLTGATYEFLDDSRQAALAQHYFLEDVDLNGRVTRHGPFAVARPSRHAPPVTIDPRTSRMLD